MAISNDTKKSIIDMYENGISNKTFIAEQHDVSSRSVGRIIDAYLSEKHDLPTDNSTDTETINVADIQEDTTIDTQKVKKTISCFDLYALNGSVKVQHEFPFTNQEANTDGYAVSGYFKQFLDDLHRQTDEIGAMCDTLQKIDTPYNLEINREVLVGLIARLRWYELDIASIDIKVHKAAEETD